MNASLLGEQTDFSGADSNPKKRPKSKRDFFFFLKGCECLLFFFRLSAQDLFFFQSHEALLSSPSISAVPSAKAPLPITPWSSEEFWERGQDLSSGIQREQREKIDSRLIKFVELVLPEK